LANAPSGQNVRIENQHSNGVTMESLQVYKLFKQATKPDLQTLYEAYQEDMVTIRDALA
jgi:hypothetical protein